MTHQYKIDPQKRDHLGLYKFPLGNIFEGIRIKKIKKVAAIQGGYNVLEVGCGHGHVLDVILKKNAKVIGVDINFNSLMISNKRLDGKDVSLIQSNAHNLPFKDKTFNVLICSEVLEHLPNLEEVLKEFKRVIKPNGKIIITVPNDPLMRIARLIYWPFLEYKSLVAETHIHNFTKNSLKKLLARYFRVQYVRLLYGIRLFALVRVD
jgi:ubiquinone/menaquinone biosynthesis C-methylase UbiE